MAALFKRSKTEGASPDAPTIDSQEHISVMPQISEKQPPLAPNEQPAQQIQPTETVQPEIQPLTELKGGVAVELQKPGVHASTQATDDSSNAVQMPVQPQAVKSKEREEIESILSEGLTEIYQGMTPQEQERFRAKGEEAASAIEQMMHGFKATARKVIRLIREWLATIPRVNKYFLEQESKLKTDEMIKLQRKLKKAYRINKRLGK